MTQKALIRNFRSRTGITSCQGRGLYYSKKLKHFLYVSPCSEAAVNSFYFVIAK
jgi:hypothetical protein